MWANVKKVSLTRLSNSVGEGCRPAISASMLKDEISSMCTCSIIGMLFVRFNFCKPIFHTVV